MMRPARTDRLATRARWRAAGIKCGCVANGASLTRAEFEQDGALRQNLEAAKKGPLRAELVTQIKQRWSAVGHDASV